MLQDLPGARATERHPNRADRDPGPHPDREPQRRIPHPSTRLRSAAVHPRRGERRG